jgi:fructose-bisphosphate aldolase class I
LNNHHNWLADQLQEIRRAYRQNFYTADIGKSISGAILFKETLLQSSSDGVPFVTCLERQGVLPGIKVDQVLETAIFQP